MQTFSVLWNIILFDFWNLKFEKKSWNEECCIDSTKSHLNATLLMSVALTVLNLNGTLLMSVALRLCTVNAILLTNSLENTSLLTHQINFKHKIVMAFQWPLSGLWVAFEWPLSGLWVDFEWPFMGILMTLQWPFNGLSVAISWPFCGLLMIFSGLSAASLWSRNHKLKCIYNAKAKTRKIVKKEGNIFKL